MSKFMKLTKCHFILICLVFFISISIPTVFSTTKAYGTPQYPYQAVKIVTQLPGSRTNLNITFYTSNSSVTTKEESGDSWERWNFVTTDGQYFKIVNEKSGLILTPSKFQAADNTACVIYEDLSKDEQLWQIVGEDKDTNKTKNKDDYGNYLNYKIVNKTNPDLALTLDTYKYNLYLRTYSNQDNQHWKLCSDGLDGFAGLCKDSNVKDKGPTIGGLLGKTIEVNTVEDFYTQISDNLPKTIIIGTSLDTEKIENEPKSIGSNKTIIGAYGVQLKDFMLNTAIDDTNGSKNIIIKNITFVNSHGSGKNTPLTITNNSQNIWLDHNTIIGNIGTEREHVSDTSDTLYTSCNSLKIQGMADFITVSYNKFSDRYYALSIGEPKNNMKEYKGYPHVTLSGNYFENNHQGCPSIYYATIHILNNYIHNSYYGIEDNYGPTIYSEANNFEDVTTAAYAPLYNASDSTFRDVGSITDYVYTKTDTDGDKITTVSKIDVSAPLIVTSWYPTMNYSYNKFSASTTDNRIYDAKKFCTLYSGAVSASDQLKYKNYDEFKDSILKIK